MNSVTATADSSVVTRRLAGQSAFLMVGNAFTLAVGFPFQIYIARTLGAGNLGVFGLLDVAVQTIAALCSLGVGNLAVRFIPEYMADGRASHVRHLVRSVYKLAFTSGIIAASVLVLCRPWLLAMFESLRPYSNAILLMSVMVPVGMLLGVSQQVLRGFFDIRYLVAMSSFLQLILKVALTAFFCSLGMNLVGYVAAVVISSVVCLLGMLIGIGRHLSCLPVDNNDGLPVDRAEWWSYGRVMYGNSLLGMVAAPLEGSLLAGVIDVSAVGVLVVIRQLNSFPQIFLQVIIAIVAPMFVAARERTEVAHLYHLATDWMCRLAFPLLLFLMVRASSILSVYGVGFSALGSSALMIISVAQAVNLVCGPVGNMLNMKGFQTQMFYVSIASSILLIIGTVILVPSLGLSGIAVATAVSTSVANIWALRVSNACLGISWYSRRYRRWVMPTLAALAYLLTIAYLIPGDTKWWLCGEFAGCFITFHVAYWANGVCAEDLELVAMLRRQLARKSRTPG